MVPPPRTVDPELLLAETGWVRALARRLVLDEGLAEDVVQDTWVAALEASPQRAAQGRLRAWLAVVARNLALRRRRREAVRRAVERAAARPERTGERDEVGRLQLQRALMDAVLALDEPYRSAVVLRHLDGLSAAEIARRHGCSVAAARQRVSRGTAQLRSRLERQLGPHADGLLALAPLLDRGWSGSLLTGGIALSSKLTLGAACAALAALALWIATAGGPGRDAPPADEPVPAAALRAAETGPAHEPDDRLEAAAIASEPAGAGSPRSRLDEVERGAAPRAWQLRGLVTDTHARPLASALLRIAGLSQPLELTSDSEGRIAGELDFVPQGELHEVRASCAGYVPRTLQLDLARPLAITLQTLPWITGRLLDPEGVEVSPPGYVNVTVLDALTLETRRGEGALGEDGSYRIAAPLGRLVSLEARARGYSATVLALDHALEPEGAIELDVELARGAVVTGTVLDARTRTPVPGATVWMEAFEPEEGSVHPTTRADGEGRFRIEGANEEVTVEGGVRSVFFWLLARADGYAASPMHGYGAQANDEHAYDFEMLLEPAGGSLRVHAMLEDGRVAGGATVWAIDAQGNPYFESADPEGVHAFENLPPGPFALWLAYEDRVRAAGLDAEVMLGLHALRADLELAPGEARSEELVLEPPGKASLVGRLVDVAGRGVPDFAVRCQLNFQLGSLMLASGWDETRTDADGRYSFEGQHRGKYQVWASGEGTALACASPPHVYVDLAADERSEVQDLVVGACMTIEGRVEAPRLDLGELELSVLDRSGAVHAETRRAADGSFRFEPLVARDYEVVVRRGGTVLDRATVSASSSTGLFLRAR
jgi:RNA polymerase sigma factor (sigma-70 family)